ncbi:MAG: hypothetical protein IID45_06950 [Planctomycetes bacterium]|nr:hypothetical protein [Planctomycetota bacterium]
MSMDTEIQQESVVEDAPQAAKKPRRRRDKESRKSRQRIESSKNESADNNRSDRGKKTDPVQNEMQKLQGELSQKNEVVAALTQRLEQAANQLDRLRRTGTNGGDLSANGGIPADLLQEQRELAEELQRAVQQWEDMQLGSSLGRIECQVTELRDLVSSKLSATLSQQHGSIDSLPPAQQTAATSLLSSSPAKVEKSAEVVPDSYAAFKAGLLADVDTGSAPEQQAKETETAKTETDSVPADDNGSGGEIFDVDPPGPIDLEAAGIEELRCAVEARDAYIAVLIGKMRVLESAPRLGGDWSALENVPDELRARLNDYELELQETMKQAEVENSLERARLGREAARLELKEQQLQKKMRQMGIASDGTQESDSDDDDIHRPRKSRKWLRLMGLGGKEDGVD